jgi:ribosomal L13-like protein
MDTGDHVIVVNARAVRLTGGKDQTKVAYRHSGFPGGIRELPYSRLLVERPATAVERAVRGMLPKNRLGRAMLRKLSVYEGPEHPHQAQKPAPLGVGEIPKWEGLPARPAPEPAPKPSRPASRSRATAAPATPAPATRRRSGTSTTTVPEKPAPTRRRRSEEPEATADAPAAPRRRARRASGEQEAAVEGSRTRSTRTPRSSRSKKKES